MVATALATAVEAATVAFVQEVSDATIANKKDISAVNAQILLERKVVTIVAVRATLAVTAPSPERSVRRIALIVTNLDTLLPNVLLVQPTINCLPTGCVF